MEIPFRLKRNERDKVSQPDGIQLFRGTIWIAAGNIGISFMTTTVPKQLKLVLSVIGIVFCLIGAKCCATLKEKHLLKCANRNMRNS